MRPSPSRIAAAGRRAAIAAGLPALALWLALGLPGAATAAPAGTATTPAARAERETLPIPEGSSGPTAVTEGIGGTIVRLGLGLAVVIGLIAAVWYVMKRIQRSRYPAVAESPSSLIDVVSTTSLGPARSLHLVRVGEELVLLGATDQSVTALARLDAEQAAALVDLAPPGPRFGAPPAGPGGPGVDDRARAVATSNDASLVERLRALTTRR